MNKAAPHGKQVNQRQGALCSQAGTEGLRGGVASQGRASLLPS